MLAALPLLAPLLPAGEAWGFDALLFLPRLAGPLALLVAVGLPLLLLRLPAPPRGTFARGVLAVLALCALAALAWRYRVAHVLLGDGIPITTTLPEQHAPHPREPLASWLLLQAWRLLGPVLAQPGLAREALVMRVVGLASVTAGVVFALAAAGVAREGLRAFPARGAAGAGAPREGALFVAALLAQGAGLVFLGYVELYAWPAAAAMLFVWAMLRALRGSWPLLPALAAFALAVAFHFSNLVLAPALLVACAALLASADTRAAAARDLALFAVGAIAAAALARAGGYDVAAHVRDLVASNAAAPEYLLSRVHLRDFLNEHVRIGPLGLAFTLALALPFARLRDDASAGAAAARAFVGALALTIVAATWRTPDMPLGYARDWDVFAAAGLVLAAAALLALLAVAREPGVRRALLAGALGVSLWHGVPWFALNHSEPASLARFATLPLGLGRTQSTLAWWWMQRGDHAQARTWIERSLRENPDNIRAVDLYGRIALLEGRPAIAVQAYRTGIVMRPERPEYRLQLAFALQSAGRAAEALAALDTLAATHPREPALWLQRALGHATLGRADSARRCLDHALALNPALAPTARQLLPSLMEGR